MLAPAEANLDRLVELTGSKQTLLAEGRRLAEANNLTKPSSSADVAEDPLLAALVAAQVATAA